MRRMWKTMIFSTLAHISSRSFFLHLIFGEDYTARAPTSINHRDISHFSLSLSLQRISIAFVLSAAALIWRHQFAALYIDIRAIYWTDCSVMGGWVRYLSQTERCIQLLLFRGWDNFENPVPFLFQWVDIWEEMVFCLTCSKRLRRHLNVSRDRDRDRESQKQQQLHYASPFCTMTPISIFCCHVKATKDGKGEKDGKHTQRHLRRLSASVIEIEELFSLSPINIREWRTLSRRCCQLPWGTTLFCTYFSPVLLWLKFIS